MLQGLPVQALGYPALLLAHGLVQLAGRRLPRLQRLAVALHRASCALLQLSLGQFVFYSALQLARGWTGTEPRTLSSLVLGAGLVARCAWELSETARWASREPLWGKRAGPRRACWLEPCAQGAEGLSRSGAARRRARLLNVAATSRCMAFPTVIVGLQRAPGACLGLLALLQLGCFGEFVYLSLVSAPFDGCLSAAKRWSAELAVVGLLLSCCCRALDYYSAGVDYLALLLVAAALLAHAAGVAADASQLCRREKPPDRRKVTFEAKGALLQTTFTKRTTGTAASSHVRPLTLNSILHSTTLPLSQKLSLQKKISIIGNNASVEDRQILQGKLQKLRSEPDKELSPGSKASSKHSLLPGGNRVRKISMQKVQAAPTDKQLSSHPKYFKQIWIKKEPRAVSPVLPAG